MYTLQYSDIIWYSTIKCGLASFTDGQNNLANFTVVVRAIKLINIIIIKLTIRN